MGGMLPTLIRMTHTRTQVVMSLVSGLMLGVAFYHLLPHSVALVGGSRGVDTTVWWLMIGLIVMLLLLRVFHFHQHDFSKEEGVQHDHHHQHHEHDSPVHGLSWVGLALGLAVHTLIDGVALGAVMHAGSVAGGLIGIGVFLAIFLHKPLDAMSIVTVMEAGGWSRQARVPRQSGICSHVSIGSAAVFLRRGCGGRQSQPHGGCRAGFFGGSIYLYRPE